MGAGIWTFSSGFLFPPKEVPVKIPLIFIPPLTTYNEHLMNFEHRTGTRENLLYQFEEARILMKDLILLLQGSEFKNSKQIVDRFKQVVDNSKRAEENLYKLIAKRKQFKSSYIHILNVITEEMENYFKHRINLNASYEIQIQASRVEVDSLITASHACLVDF